MFTGKSYFINSHSQTKRSCGMPADRWFLQMIVFSDPIEYYDPNHCKWQVEDQAPCTTEGPTAVPTTTNADMDYCEQLDSKWTCSSGLSINQQCPKFYNSLFVTCISLKWLNPILGNEKQSLCIKFCAGSYTTEHRKCFCKQSNCSWSTKGRSCPDVSIDDGNLLFETSNLGSLRSFMREINIQNNGTINFNFQLWTWTMSPLIYICIL